MPFRFAKVRVFFFSAKALRKKEAGSAECEGVARQCEGVGGWERGGGWGMLLEGEAGSVLADSFLLLDPVFVEDDFADVGAGRKEVGVCADVPFCAFRREADA